MTHLKKRISIPSLLIAILFSGSTLIAAGPNWQKKKVNWRLPDGSEARAIYQPPGLDLLTPGRKEPKRPRRVPLPPQAAGRIESRKGGPEAQRAEQALVIDAPPIDGFVPWIAVTATDAADEELVLDAVPHTSATGAFLAADPLNEYAIGIWDTGASISILGYADASRLGLFSASPDYVTSSTVAITGVTGSVDAWVSMPMGLFMDGLGAIDAVTGELDTSQMVGESNVSIGVGQAVFGDQPDLPTVMGAPMSVYFAGVVNNEQAWTVNYAGDQYTAPDIQFYDRDDIAVPDHPITVPLELRPLGAVSVQYTPCVDTYGCPDGFGTPQSPSIIIGNTSQSLFFVSSVDMYERRESAIDKDRFLLDTGAQISVIGNRVGARLGLDPNNPEFEVEVQGVSGEITLLPGYTIDKVEIPALGEWLSFTQVPVVLLDVASPEGGTLDGIIGMNLLLNYNFVLRGGGMFNQPDPTLELALIIPDAIDVDFDNDGDVDQADFAFLQRCYTGPDLVQDDSLCAPALLDSDDDVDMQDLELFNGCATAPEIQAAADCR
jgi:predicted aspartyl protease